MTTLANLKQIFRESVNAVQPATIFHNKIMELTEENKLIIRASDIVQQYDVTDKKIHIIGFGKAVYGMAIEIEKILHSKISSGIINIPCNTVASASATLPTNSLIQVYEGAKNNLPDEQAFRTSQKILEKCQSLSNCDVLIVLISGGGSALLPYPKPPLTLSEKYELIKLLANKGATINELNIVRASLSCVKGGKLAAAAKNASAVITLIVSDIINDPIDLIASGPTAVPKFSSNDAITILEKFGLVTFRLRRIIEEDSELEIDLSNTQNFVILNNQVAIDAAIAKAKILNYETIFFSKAIEGNVCKVLNDYIDLAKVENCAVPKDQFVTNLRNAINQARGSGKCGFCLIAGGETTVQVTGTGIGGRNQELALRFTKKCIENNLHNVYLLSAGSDGIDGPTTAAGAVGHYLSNIDTQLIDEYLNNSDSFTFFETKAPECHIVTGHTGTNVMDIHILLINF